MSALGAIDGLGLRFDLAGPFAVARGGSPLDIAQLGNRKARVLLKLLAVERDHVVTTERIIEILWPVEPPAQPGENVATLVSRLRKALGADAITGGRGGYRLASAPVAVVDLDEGLDLVVEAERRIGLSQPGVGLSAASRAVDILSRGRILDDEPDAPWADDAEAARRALLARARQAGATAGLHAGDLAAARAFAEAAAADDPWDEAVCRLLMTIYQASDEPARAIGAFTRLRELLDNELGVEPSPATRDLYVAILREQQQTPPVPPSAIVSMPIGAGGTRVVGREAELARLHDAWTAASAGRLGLVLLVGEAGIGKTRLAAEMVAAAASTGGTVLHSRCYETERALFLQPVVEAVSPALARLAPSELRKVVGDHAAALAALVPAFIPVLHPEPLVRGAVEIERRRSFDAITEVIGRLAARSPVLLVLDDLHNAGRATVELLHYLSRQLSTSRVLILATIRREEGRESVAALAEGAQVIEVGALSPDAVADLAASCGQAHLVDHILQQTRGHTLFVIETLAALESGGEGVPPSLQAAVLERVARVGPDVETALRAAAVLGAALDVADLVAMLDISMPAVLDRCQRAFAGGLLLVADREYEFANDLVREVLYDSTPLPVRLAWHRQAVDLMTDQPEAMAVHAAAAGDWARAARAWLLASEDALRRYAAADAVALVSRAIDAASRVSNVEVTARGHVLRGRAREARSEYELALADLQTAVALAREVGDQRVEMIALRQLAGDVPVALGLSVAQAVGYLERGLGLAEALGDRAMEVDLLARMAVIAANRLCFNESVEHGRRAVAIARTVHDEVVLAAALDGLKTGHAYLGEIAELARVIAELEPLLRRQDDRVRLHWTVFESAFPFVAAAQWDDALARIETAASINREVGYTIYYAWYDAHVAWVHRMRGDLAQALKFGRRAVESAGVGHPWWRVTANTMLATTLLELGERDEAIGLLEEARTLADRDGAEAYLLRSLAPLADATGSRQTLDQADALLHSISTPAGAAWIWGSDAYLAVARAWLNAGEPARARAALAPLIVAVTRVPWVVQLTDALLVDGRAAAALGAHAEAAELFSRAGAVAAEHGLRRQIDLAAAEAVGVLKAH
jgi:DNA-binding SARP family transcriptional activator/tetratricopeptide (TPR) repeat protein